MSKVNLSPRQFETKFRMSTVLHPNFDSKMQATAHSYTDVRTISTRGSWPMVHMIDEDTFVQMAILAGHIDLKNPPKKRVGTNKKGFRPS